MSVAASVSRPSSARRRIPPKTRIVTRPPGSTVGEPPAEALPRVGRMMRQALGESDRCRLLLENTAGAGNTIGRSFEELRELVDLAGGDGRIGICLDSCHMFASGFDISTADKLTEVMDRGLKLVGKRGCAAFT